MCVCVCVFLPCARAKVCVVALPRWVWVNRALHGGLLRCLLNVGHLETALQRALGLLGTRGDLVDAVTPFAVEAAWR